MLLGDPRQADQRTQSFHFPIVVHQSLDPAARSSAQAPSSLSLHELQALDRLRARRHAGSMRRRGNHMHDHSRFQRDIDDVTGGSLSVSLYCSQKSLTHNIGSASALPIMKEEELQKGESLCGWDAEEDLKERAAQPDLNLRQLRLVRTKPRMVTTQRNSPPQKWQLHPESCDTSLRSDTNPVVQCLLASTSTVAWFPSKTPVRLPYTLR